VFPWGEFPKGTRLCDVGGGKGHIALGILKAFPHLRVTIQDLPDVISDAKEVGLSIFATRLSSPDPTAKFWQTAMPEALENNQVDFAAIDFLKESPVKGSDIYYVGSFFFDHGCRR
jgi:ubiquinone/menaquinone biosynthesis C-methylase UbiE